MVRKHSPSASRSVSEPFVAFSPEASASDTCSGGSLVSAVWSAMKPNRFILSVQAQQRCDSTDVTDNPRLSLKLVPLFSMLLPQPHFMPTAPCACGAGPAVGMGSLWSCRSADWPWLGYFWKEPSPNSAAHVRGLTVLPHWVFIPSWAAFLPFLNFWAHQAKQISPLHPISPQTYKPSPHQFLLTLLNWLPLPQAQAGHQWLTLQSDWECFVVLFKHGKRESVWMLVCIGTECN